MKSAKNAKTRAISESKKLTHMMIGTPPLTEECCECRRSSGSVKDARDCLCELVREIGDPASDG